MSKGLYKRTEVVSGKSEVRGPSVVSFYSQLTTYAFRLTFLSLLTTYAFRLPTYAAGFTEDFSQAGGAVYDSGGADILYNISYDTSSGNFYATGTSGNNFLTVRYNSSGNALSSATFVCQAGDAPYGVATSPVNNSVYVAGSITEDSDKSVVIIRYSNTLGFISSVTFNASLEDYGRAVAVSSAGVVYAVGYTSSNITTQYDFLTLKYSSSLVFQGSTTLNASGNDFAFSCAVSQDGSLFVTGQGFHLPTGAACYETVKFNQNLVFLSSASYGGDGYNHIASDVSLDSSGNVYVVGKTKDPNYDYRLIKYNSNLNEIANVIFSAGLTLTGTNVDRANGITARIPGNIYVAGFTQNQDYLLLRYNDSLTLVSSKTYAGANSDIAYDIISDGSGNVYAGGSSNNGASDDWRLIKYGVDTTSPASAVTYPVSISSFNVFTTISGTAQDTGGFNGLNVGLSKVEVAIRQNSDNNWWNASLSSWGAVQIFNPCTGKESWSYNGLTSSSLSVGYYWSVSRASDTSNNVETTLSAGATFYFDNVAPVAISNLTALTGTGNEGEITLKWTAPGDDGMSGTVSAYVVKYATYQIKTVDFETSATFFASWSGFASGNQEEQRTVSGLLGGTTYFFAIKARDTILNYSVWNSSIDVNTVNIANYASAKRLVPAAVTDLSADISGLTEGQIRLTWTSPGDDGTSGVLVSGSLIYIATTTSLTDAQSDSWWQTKLNSSEIVISTSGINPGFKPTYIITGLTPGVTHYFRLWVRDENPQGWSGLSSGATYYAQVDISPPAVITGFIIPDVGFRHIQLQWVAPIEDDGLLPFNTGQYLGQYQIRRATFSIDSESLWSSAIFVASSTLTTIFPGQLAGPFILSGLQNNIKYYFSVKTRDENGLWSTISSSSPAAMPYNTAPGSDYGLNPTNPLSSVGQFFVSGSFRASSSSVVNWTSPGPKWDAPDAGKSGTNSLDSEYGDSVTSYSLIYFPYYGGSSVTISGITSNTTIYNFTPVVDNNTYYWYVEAYDSEGAFRRSTIGPTLSFNLDNDAPPQFDLLQSSGLMSYAGANNNVVLRWNRTADSDPGDAIVRYAVYWSTVSSEVSYTNFTGSVTATSIFISSCSYTMLNLIEHATYWWYVIATDSGGPAGWYPVNISSSSSIWSFLVNGVNQEPNYFTQITPSSYSIFSATMGIVYTKTPTFSWNPATDPDPGDIISYDLYYSSFEGLDTYPNQTPAGTSVSTTVPALLENATYSWRVIAVDTPGSGMGPLQRSTSIWHFAVNSSSEPPTPCTLLLPSGTTSESRPYFYWTTPTDPDPFDYIYYYRLHFSTTSDFLTSVTTTTAEIYAPQTSTQVWFNLLTMVTYYWKVSAYSYNESSLSITNIYSVSQTTFNFYVSNFPPNTFDLLYPVGNTIVTNSTIDFQWQNSGDPDGNPLTYTVRYSSSSDYVVISSINAGVNVSSKSVAVLPDFSSYENKQVYWFVETVDPYYARRVSNSSTTFWLDAVSELPEQFDLTGPSTATPVNTKKPTFTWSASGDVDPGDYIASYVVYYSSDNFLTGVYSSSVSSFTLNFVPSSDLQEDTYYRWYVRAYDSRGLAVVSLSTRSFIVDEINSAPDVFDITSPSGVVRNRAPKFTWTPADKTEYWQPHTYTLHWGASQFDDFTKSGITTNYFQFSGTGTEILSENTTYWWRVEVIDSGSNKRNSGSVYYMFVSSTNEAPYAFSLIEPADNSSTLNRNPTFYWQKATDVDEPAGDRIQKYVLTWSNTSDFAISSTIETTLTSYTITSQQQLSRNTTYWWKVTAYDMQGSSMTTSVWKFFVEPLTNKLKAPEGVTGQLSGDGNYFTINWYAVTENEDGSTLEPGSLKEYRLYRSTNLVSGFQFLTQVTDKTTYTDNTLNVVYYYLVRTVNMVEAESSDSRIVSSEAQSSTIILDKDKEVYAIIPPDVRDKTKEERNKISISKVSILKDGTTVYNLKVTPVSGNTEVEIVGYKFISPVTINFKYSPSASSVGTFASSGQKQVVFWHNGIEYINIGAQYDTSKGVVYAVVSYSGKYKVQTIGTTGFSYSVEPKKIFTPNKDGIYDNIKFRYENNTGEQVSGDVFDIQGAFVAKLLSGSDQGDYLYWDGMTSQGSPARKGIYIYQLKCGNSRIYTGTIIVAR